LCFSNERNRKVLHLWADVSHNRGSLDACPYILVSTGALMDVLNDDDLEDNALVYLQVDLVLAVVHAMAMNEERTEVMKLLRKKEDLNALIKRLAVVASRVITGSTLCPVPAGTVLADVPPVNYVQCRRDVFRSMWASYVAAVN